MKYLIPILLLLGCTTEQDIRVLKLAHGLDPSHSVHKAMVYMADHAKKTSEGKLRIDIYPSQQLGSERELMELLQLGSIDMSKTSASVLENFSPQIKTLSMPYLFRDDDHMEKTLRGSIGKRLLESGTDYYLRGLCFYDSGSRSFYTKEKKIEKPSDLEGLKIRVQSSQTAIALMNAFGAAAAPIAFGELYTALQQGVVDGAENNAPSFYLTRHYEVCKYYTLNAHTQVPDVVLMSEHTWKRLSAEERMWISQAADASAVYQKELWAKSENEALAAVIKAGIEVIRPDKKLFADHVSNLAAELLGEDPEALAIYNEIKALD